jgi:uncharacterized protein YjaG (DUF416 family)
MLSGTLQRVGLCCRIMYTFIDWIEMFKSMCYIILNCKMVKIPNSPIRTEYIKFDKFEEKISPPSNDYFIHTAISAADGCMPMIKFMHKCMCIFF